MKKLILIFSLLLSFQAKAQVEILAERTLDLMSIVSVNGSPIVSGTATHNLGAGSNAYFNDNGVGRWYWKFGDGDFDWRLVMEGNIPLGGVKDGANVGAGVGVFKQEANDILEFKSLVSTKNSVAVSSSANEVILDVAIDTVTSESISDGSDLILIHDSSANDIRSMTRSDFLSSVTHNYLGNISTPSGTASVDSLDDTFNFLFPDNKLAATAEDKNIFFTLVEDYALQTEVDTLTSRVDDIEVEIACIGLITGVSVGGAITINAGDDSKIDLEAGSGVIVDWTDPFNPLCVSVSWAGQVAVTLTDIATSQFTQFTIDELGVLQQVSTISTNQARRQAIFLDAAAHSDNVSVESIAVNRILSYQGTNAVLDFIRALGPVNTGNRMSSGGANLTVQKAAGTTSTPFINADNDLQNPTTKINGTQNPLSAWANQFRDGVGGFTISPANITATDPDFYDDGSGTLASVSNNQYTIKRFYFFSQNGSTLETYGQAQYSSLAAAEISIIAENPTLTPLIATGVFVTALVIQEGVTDLDAAIIAENAKFVDITGLGSSVSGGVGTQDLQSTYLLSATPEFVTVNGALSIEAGETDNDNVLEVNNISSTNVFNVKGTGAVTSTGPITGSNLSGTNTGDEVQATETLLGIAEIATSAETLTGTDDLKYITPLKLEERILGHMHNRSLNFLGFSDGSNKPYLKNKATVYEVMFQFFYEGTDVYGPHGVVKVGISNKGVITSDVRIYNVTAGVVVAELTGFSPVTEQVFETLNIPIVIGFPTGFAELEIQMRGSNDGGGQESWLGKMIVTE